MWTCARTNAITSTSKKYWFYQTASIKRMGTSDKCSHKNWRYVGVWQNTLKILEISTAIKERLIKVWKASIMEILCLFNLIRQSCLCGREKCHGLQNTTAPKKNHIKIKQTQIKEGGKSWQPWKLGGGCVRTHCIGLSTFAFLWENSGIKMKIQIRSHDIEPCL